MAGPHPKKRTGKLLSTDIRTIKRLRIALIMHTKTERGREAVRRAESLIQSLESLKSEAAA
jgi:hypothetical protein